MEVIPQSAVMKTFVGAWRAKPQRLAIVFLYVYQQGMQSPFLVRWQFGLLARVPGGQKAPQLVEILREARLGSVQKLLPISCGFPQLSPVEQVVRMVCNSAEEGAAARGVTARGHPRGQRPSAVLVQVPSGLPRDPLNATVNR